MLDEPQPGANDAKPKSEAEGQGMVASYSDSANVDNLNPAKIVERWKGKTGTPLPDRGVQPIANAKDAAVPTPSINTPTTK